MPRRLTTFLIAAIACGAIGGCTSRQREDVNPVATPSVSLSRTEAAVGSPVDMTYRFVVAEGAPAFTEDYVVFVHFLDADGEQMWTDDHEPPTPTSRWKPGETIEYPRTIFILKFPYVGPARVELGLYSPRSGERLPLAGEDAGMRAYRVGSFNMTSQADGLFVVFKDGWHDAEVSEDGSLEWQWSTGEGVITFRNPKRDAQLILQVDQAVNAFTEPQQVDVRLGAATLDSFPLRPGVRELRRVALPASVLGPADTVEMTIAVDRTFVPAAVPALRSADARRLGIRVFRAYVEPK